MNRQNSCFRSFNIGVTLLTQLAFLSAVMIPSVSSFSIAATPSKGRSNPSSTVYQRSNGLPPIRVMSKEEMLGKIDKSRWTEKEHAAFNKRIYLENVFQKTYGFLMAPHTFFDRLQKKATESRFYPLSILASLGVGLIQVANAIPAGILSGAATLFSYPFVHYFAKRKAARDTIAQVKVRENLNKLVFPSQTGEGSSATPQMLSTVSRKYTQSESGSPRSDYDFMPTPFKLNLSPQTGCGSNCPQTEN